MIKQARDFAIFVFISSLILSYYGFIIGAMFGLGFYIVARPILDRIEIVVETIFK